MSMLRRILFGSGAVLAAAATLTVLPSTAPEPVAHAADPNDFSYDSWHFDYEISTTDEERAVARVTETLTARFPEFDQNRGIVRGIPIDYEGASTDPRDFSVTDENGDPVPFEVESEDGFTAVLTGDDEYVHGRQTYVIQYTLSDVVLSRDDGAADEFYWDIADFEHLQPVASLSAEISFSSDLAEQLDGNARCYIGGAGSTQECGIERTGSSFTLSAGPLDAREGATVAIGLEPGSVAQPSERVPSFTYDALPAIAGGASAAVGIAGLAAIVALRRKHRTGRGTIVAQYDVPPQLPPLVAAPVVGNASAPVAAEIVHLAVQGAIRIEEGEPEQGFFGPKATQPDLRLLDASRAVDPVSSRMVSTLFSEFASGPVLSVPKQSEKFGERMRSVQSLGAKAAVDRGYFQKIASRPGRILGVIGIVCSIAVLLFSLIAVSNRGGAAPVIGLICGAAALVMSIIAVCPHQVHTPAGAETREYLEGVRLFIRVAEADRIAVLQSYTGAERRQDGSVDVIHLYEKLLPYAVLFGLEKQWARTLAFHYEQSPGYSPYWYPALATHGIGSLDSTISQFTGSLASSASYTSSSSGGSSGGGSVGGGGGGGFSGGR